MPKDKILIYKHNVYHGNNLIELQNHIPSPLSLETYIISKNIQGKIYDEPTTLFSLPFNINDYFYISFALSGNANFQWDYTVGSSSTAINLHFMIPLKETYYHDLVVGWHSAYLEKSDGNNKSTTMEAILNVFMKSDTRTMFIGNVNDINNEVRRQDSCFALPSQNTVRMRSISKYAHGDIQFNIEYTFKITAIKLLA